MTNIINLINYILFIIVIHVILKIYLNDTIEESYIHYQPEMNNYFDEITNDIYNSDIKNELTNFLDSEANITKESEDQHKNENEKKNTLNSIEAYDGGNNSYFIL